MVAALGSCDKARLAKAVKGGLNAELEAKFDPMCKTVTWFGPLVKRDQTSIHVSDSGNEGAYELEFEKGKLTMSISIQDNQVAGFQLTGDDWIVAKRGLEAQQYPEFKVYDFDFVDAEGKVMSPTAYPKGKIMYRIKIGGMAPKDGKFSLASKVAILDAEGKVLWTSPEPMPIEFPADENAIARSGTVDASINIPVAGPHQIAFEIKDFPSDATTKYVQAITTVD